MINLAPKNIEEGHIAALFQAYSFVGQDPSP
jgi:hypothetical protein